MGVWEEVTRLVYGATFNGRDLVCRLSCLVRTGAVPKFFGEPKLLISEHTAFFFLDIKIMYLNVLVQPKYIAYIDVYNEICCG